jgi:hypothetical protein
MSSKNDIKKIESALFRGRKSPQLTDEEVDILQKFLDQKKKTVKNDIKIVSPKV